MDEYFLFYLILYVIYSKYINLNKSYRYVYISTSFQGNSKKVQIKSGASSSLLDTDADGINKSFKGSEIDRTKQGIE